MGAILKKAFLSVAIETTRGTPISPDPGVNIRINTDIKVSPNLDMTPMEFASGRHSEAPGVPGKQDAKLDFSFYPRPGASVGLAPNWGKLFKMCGLLEKVTLLSSADLITANSTVVTVGGNVTTATVYATSHALTMAAIATKVAALTGVLACTVNGDNLIVVMKPESGPLAVSAVTTLGASQPTWTTPSVAYFPDQSQDEISATAWMYKVPVSGNLIRDVLKGVSGELTLSWEKGGQPWKAAIASQAALKSIDDNAGVTPLSQDSTILPTTVGSTSSILGITTAQILKVELKDGNKLEMEQDNKDTTGILAYRIAERHPTLKFTVYTKLKATEDWITPWLAGSAGSFSFSTPTNGTVRHVLTCPNIQIQKITEAGEDGAHTYEIEAKCLETLGNDEWNFAMTA